MKFVRAVLLATVSLAALSAAAAQPQFPPLTGRVVDQAGLLSASARQSLSEKLAGHERATGEQVVVVTVNSLGGLPIEQYGYRLGRHWGIGQKGKDNGALLVVAPRERKVRIEVGYGLEGKLTDALTFNIIDQVILPEFRQGHFEVGIVAGADAILQALGGKYKRREAHRRHANPWGALIILMLIFGGGFLPMLLRPHGYGRYRTRRLGGFWGVGGFGGGIGRGGFGGGGFSGGGGSFGGGGASGGW